MTSIDNTTATIETLARECAAQALDQGATGPWTGDLQGPDLDHVATELGRPMTRDELAVFDRAFRAACANTSAITYDAAKRAAAAWHEIVWGARAEGAEYVVEHDGEAYIVTTGTGDCDGGAFAYDAEDVAEWVAQYTPGEPDADGVRVRPYQDFCEYTSPVETAALARAVHAKLGLTLFRAGACTPIVEPRTEDAWWSWHDEDYERHYPSVEEAEEACRAWVAGESDVGPV